MIYLFVVECEVHYLKRFFKFKRNYDILWKYVLVSIRRV